MARFLYLATILLTISLVFAEDAASDSDTSDPEPTTTEGKAGEAIKTLLQEKITQKFKEAANEVKGVLVKQLGDSLKSAHEVFKSRDKAKVNAANTAKVQGKQGAAAIHQNKANRHRKNSGPAGAGGKPPTEAKNGAPVPVEGKGPGPIEGKGPGPIEGKGPGLQEAKGPGPMAPPPPMPQQCAPQPPCGPPPMDMQCCHNLQEGQTQYMNTNVNLPPPPMPPMAPMAMGGCAPGPCQQTCGPSCTPQQCCLGKRSKILHKSKKVKKE